MPAHFVVKVVKTWKMIYANPRYINRLLPVYPNTPQYIMASGERTTLAEYAAKFTLREAKEQIPCGPDGNRRAGYSIVRADMIAERKDDGE